MEWVLNNGVILIGCSVGMVFAYEFVNKHIISTHNSQLNLTKPFMQRRLRSKYKNEGYDAFTLKGDLNERL